MLSRSVTMSLSKKRRLATAVSPQLTTSSAIASATPTSVKSNRWLRCRPTPNAFQQEQQHAGGQHHQQRRDEGELGSVERHSATRRLGAAAARSLDLHGGVSHPLEVGRARVFPPSAAGSS